MSTNKDTTNAAPQGQPELPREWRDAAHNAPAGAAHRDSYRGA